jgi:pyruvate,orthophosphate dikinase
VAHTQEEIAGLRGQFPQDPIILLRPGTAPDDIPLILQIDGIVTGLGGATSHAALVAQRLGRACVVGCTALEVDAHAGRSTLGGRQFATGDPISINGFDGTIYWGKRASTIVRRQTLA